MNRPSLLPSGPSPSPQPARMSAWVRWRTITLARPTCSRATIVRRSPISGRPYRPSRGHGASSASVKSSCLPWPPVAYLAWCHAELGTFTEGRALGEEGLRIAEAVAHPTSLMFVSRGLGLLALRQGDLPRALPRLEQAMGICRDADMPGLPLCDGCGTWGRHTPWLGASPTPCHCSRGRWNRQLPWKWWPIRRSVVSPWGRHNCWLAAWRRRTPSLSGRWHTPVRTANVATKPMPCVSSARLRRIALLRRSSRLRLTTAMPLPWLRS